MWCLVSQTNGSRFKSACFVFIFLQRFHAHIVIRSMLTRVIWTNISRFMSAIIFIRVKNADKDFDCRWNFDAILLNIARNIKRNPMKIQLKPNEKLVEFTLLWNWNVIYFNQFVRTTVLYFSYESKKKKNVEIQRIWSVYHQNIDWKRCFIRTKNFWHFPIFHELLNFWMRFYWFKSMWHWTFAALMAIMTSKIMVELIQISNTDCRWSNRYEKTRDWLLRFKRIKFTRL